MRAEDKKNLLENVFLQKGSELSDNHGLRLKRAEIENDSLLYSWGNSANGKLGISDNLHQLYEEDCLAGFYCSDDLQCHSDDVDSYRVKMGFGKDDNDKNALTDEEIRNLIKFDSKLLFTHTPQPIVSLLGVQISKLESGPSHSLLLTKDKQLFTWGSNEQGQLGMPRAQTQKLVEFTNFIEQGDSAADDYKNMLKVDNIPSA